MIDVPGVAAFRFGIRGGVAAAGYPGAGRDLIREVCHRAILPLVLQYRGREVLHASAVFTPRGVVGLCGTSGTGKSTIAYALGLRGYRVWADDALVFRVASGRVESLPLVFDLRLGPASARHFGLRPGTGVVGAGRSGNGRSSARPLAALCVLRRARAAGPPAAGFVPLEPARAFTALLPHAYCLDLNDMGRKSKMIRRYLALAACVPVFEIRFSGGLAGLGAVIEAVERAAVGRVHA